MFRALATIETRKDVSQKIFKVDVEWSYATYGTKAPIHIDRPHTYSITLPLAVAKRFVRAVNDQKVFANPELAHDIYGKSYVRANSLVMGRRANADLKKLGY